MTKNSIVLSSLKFVFIEVIGDILYLPIWWYTSGFFRIAKSVENSVIDILNSFNIKILFRHLLTPMYGDYSKSGRAISFFVRIVHFFVLFGISLIWIGIVIIGAFLWLIIPVVIVMGILYQIFGGDYILNLLNVS